MRRRNGIRRGSAVGRACTRCGINGCSFYLPQSRCLGFIDGLGGGESKKSGVWSGKAAAAGQTGSHEGSRKEAVWFGSRGALAPAPRPRREDQFHGPEPCRLYLGGGEGGDWSDGHGHGAARSMARPAGGGQPPSTGAAIEGGVSERAVLGWPGRVRDGVGAAPCRCPCDCELRTGRPDHQT